MLESFIVSLIANMATSAGAEVLSSIVGNSVYRKIETAYSKALKKWSQNQGIINREQIWIQKRLDELVLLMSDPSKEAEIDKNTLNLLLLFQSELLKDTATWHYIESKFIKNSANVLLDIQRAVSSIQQNIYEINASSIEQSLTHSVYPVNTYAFVDIIEAIEYYCKGTKKPFIIIDGLNENNSPQLLSANLCNFIRELISHEY